MLHVHCPNVLGSDWVEVQGQIISLHSAISFAVAIKYMEDRKASRKRPRSLQMALDSFQISHFVQWNNRYTKKA